MSGKLTSIESYPELIKRLRKQIQEGQIQARQAAEKEKAIAYWNMGDMIAGHILKNKKRAGYGEMVYEKLEKDILIDRKTLL